MMKKTLKYADKDIVLIALEGLEQGDSILVNGQHSDLVAGESVPLGHKIASCDIPAGGAIIKFGHVIGYATEKISAGAYVHVHNVRDAVTDWAQMVHKYDGSTVCELPDTLLLKSSPKLSGFRRKDGLVGFRNHLLIISTVVCANQPVEELGHRHRDYITISNPTGCVILPNETERLKAFLLGLARNPNVGGVIFCGLGCEAVDAAWYCEQMRGEKPMEYVRIQSCGSCEKALEELERISAAMKRELDGQKPQPASLSDVRLGTKCGGSDWTTAAVANPAIGILSDIVVKNGGISMQGETTGWFGAEDFFLKHARTKEVAQRIIELMNITYAKCIGAGRHIEEGNPTPGNIEGGITTLAEKALGNVKKGGNAPVEGVIDIGEYPPRTPGLYIADNPGLDPISLAGLTASGANVLIYSTGRGSPVGTPVAPSIKVTASPTAMSIFSAHMDVDISDVTFGECTLEDGAGRLLEKLVAVCNGEETISEKNRNREIAFPLAVSPL